METSKKELNDKIALKGYRLLSETFHRGGSNDFMLGMMCGIIQSTEETLHILNLIDYGKIFKADKE